MSLLRLLGILGFLLLFLFLIVPIVSAQEFRASVSGVVSDPSVAAVPGATITLRNLEKNTVTTTTSGPTGEYLFPFVLPGRYELSAEMRGFKRFVLENVELQVNEKRRVDITLQLGGVQESVTVRDTYALLETETATRGQVIDNRMIANLPTMGGNAWQLVWQAPGTLKVGGWRYLRPLDIGGTSGLSINGGKNKENEVLLDGLTNVRGDRTVALVPSMDAIQEFKVHTSTYDAQYGRQGGGTINISLKSGTNALHGALFEKMQNSFFNANTWQLNAGGIPKPGQRINTFGFEVDGPFYIPKLFDGRNRLFFMLSYEGIRQRSGDPSATTFPLMEWRSGDFSTLLNAQGQPVIIYDPLSTRRDGAGNLVRDALAGNKIPTARLNPIAVKALTYYPPPNNPGVGPAHINNYIYPSRWVLNMDEWIGRVDFVVNQKNNTFFRYGQNPMYERRSTLWGTNPAEPSGNQPLIRGARDWVLDWTSVWNPTTAFNLRGGLARWESFSSSMGHSFDPRQLGFPDSLVSQFSYLHFPHFSLGTYNDFGASRTVSYETDDAYSLQVNLNKVVRRHTMKWGAEFRLYNQNRPSPGKASGDYSFGKNWTQRDPLRSDATSGNELATFLLGFPSSGSVDRTIDPAWQWKYYALYFQDDLKLTSRLTFNLGLRWDYETPLAERYNRMNRGFALDQPSPLKAPGLNLTGGLLFADSQNRYAFEPDKNNIQPRVGVAYRLTGKTVLRGGYALFYLGQAEAGGTTGFSRTTTMPGGNSTDGGLTPANSLSNPFPNGILQPTGNTLGPATNLGLGVGFNYLNRPLPYSHQYSFDIERELPGSILVQAGYVGNIARKLPVGVELNAIPAAEMGKAASYYTERIPNPMAGLVPDNAGKNGATIVRQDLLRPYPQYTSVGMSNIPIGRMRYHGFQGKVTKRLTHGLSFLASYTIAKNLEKVNFQNAQDFNLKDIEGSRLEKRLAGSDSIGENDVPQKLVLSGTYDLPYGKGRKWGSTVPVVWDRILGGWQVNWLTTFQSGFSINYPNGVAQQARSAKLDPDKRTLYRWFDNSRGPDGLWPTQPPAAFTLRNYPLRFPDVRLPGINNWDLSVFKNFPITERMRLQFRSEFINAFNHPWFNSMASGGADVTSARFGQLNIEQQNLPRYIQFTLKLLF